MSGSFEKSVKGGTKIKLAAPKSKYVEHILVATQTGEAGVGEVFRTLQHRLRDSTWTIVFKALIIVHLMIREGEANVTLRYLAESPSKLAISNFSDAQIQGRNIRQYYGYLLSRAKAYRDTRLDWVRDGKGRLKRLTVDKGLLRECDIVQKQIATLLKCNLFDNDSENEISLTAFRLLTMDLLTLYHVMNEGTINVLEHYFEMSKVDAERALSIYKTFSKQTEEVVGFLSTARQYENATRLEIPKLKHAPTSLTKSLEEYLNDPDFEINRRQYVAQQEAKKSGKSKAVINDASDEFAKLSFQASTPKASQQASTQQNIPKPEPKGPAPDLIDFFESIEQNQQPMMAPQQQQIPGIQSIPSYQFPQQAFIPTGAQPQHQQPNGAVNNVNPFANMISPQQAQGPGQQSMDSFNTQPFDSNQMPNAFAGQSDVFSQQPPGPGQLQSQHSFGPGAGAQGSGMIQPQQQIPAQFALGNHSGQSVQSPFASQLQSQPTNPFRQSMMPQAPPSASASSAFATSSTFEPTGSSTYKSTNPFARSDFSQSPLQNQSPSFGNIVGSSTGQAFSPQALQTSQSFHTGQSLQNQQPLQPTPTGTNPFIRSAPSSTIASPMAPQPTGTNPFRQSAFVNNQTGHGWEAHQGTIGGLEKLDTIPVFPRPLGQPQATPQQNTQAWPRIVP